MSEITDLELNELGLSQHKVAHIRSLQSKVIADRHYLRNIRSLEHDRAAIALKQIDGIGSWEAKIILLYYFYSENVFVYDDVLLEKAIRYLYDPEPNDYADIIERWHPYKSVACICLWRWIDKFGTKLLGAEP